MADDPDALGSKESKDRRRPRLLTGIAFAVVIVICALTVWLLNARPSASGGMAVTVNTTVPPETPPINPKKEQDAKSR